MKTLITKSDGTPTKSKVHALQFLEKNGIPKELLIEENGQFFYDEEGIKEEDLPMATPMPKDELPPVAEIFEHTKPLMESDPIFKPVVWDTPIYDKNNNKTKLVVIGTDVMATINGKHPAGQNRNVSAFELNIGNENFIMSLDLISRLFKVMEG